METQFDLIPPGTRVEANGEGQRKEIRDSPTRTYLCTLIITEQIEQESVDVSIWGSADGDNWPGKPILKLPQRFYRGETRMVLDLTLRPDLRFIKAKWELNRWGRVAPLPMFVLSLQLREIPAMPKRVPVESVAAGS